MRQDARRSGTVRARRLAAASVAVALLLPAAPALSDRRDQKAADLYTEAVAQARKGRYREAAEKLNQALARGATEPNEQQGTETRYLVKRYDPYYWLGVAQMELGLLDQALVNFEKSETYGVVTRWPEEHADLKRRKALLLARLEPAAPPTVLAAAPTAVPAPTAFAVAAAPTATPFSIALPTREADVAARAPSPAAPAPPSARPAAAEALALSLDALAKGAWDEAERRLLEAESAEPRAPQPHLVRALLLSTRFVLEGERDEALLSRARESIAAWRRKAGERRPLPPILSPAVRKLLAPPGGSGPA